MSPALNALAAELETKSEPLRRVLSALESRGQSPLATFGHLAWCPVRKHDLPHLFIGVAEDGVVALQCRAGCRFDEICEGLELEPADLFNGEKGGIIVPDEARGFAALLICRSCGSSICDVNHWVDRSLQAAVIKCYECGAEGRLTGFSVGRSSVSPSVVAVARKDAPWVTQRPDREPAP